MVFSFAFCPTIAFQPPSYFGARLMVALACAAMPGSGEALRDIAACLETSPGASPRCSSAPLASTAESSPASSLVGGDPGVWSWLHNLLKCCSQRLRQLSRQRHRRRMAILHAIDMLARHSALLGKLLLRPTLRFAKVANVFSDRHVARLTEGEGGVK